MSANTLEQRIARLERLVKEDGNTQAAEKGPEDYLKTLQTMILKNKKLNPKGWSPEKCCTIEVRDGKHILNVNSYIGKWYLYIEITDPLYLDRESLSEFKKVVGVFCKINKCLVDVICRNDRIDKEHMEFVLKRWPGMPTAKPEPKPKTSYMPKHRSSYRRHDDDDELDYSDPEYQDMRRAADWAYNQRNTKSWGS